MRNLLIKRGVAGLFAILILAGFSFLIGEVYGAQYLVNVNTSSVNGSSGYLDFQFNPGGLDSQSANVTITGFTGGVLGGAPVVAGNVTGTLPGTVWFVNNQPYNDYFQDFTYGNAFSFIVSLAGPALESPNGTSATSSTFLVGLYDNSQIPILTTDFSGSVGAIDINLDGTTTSTSFPMSEGSGSVVTFDELTVPEPCTLLLLAVGMGILYWQGRSRHTRHKKF